MLTLEQLIKLGENINIDIFNGLNLPEGSPLDRLTLINTIIMKCGLNIPMYADPSVMASAINVWSAKNQYTFEHVGKIYLAEYSPIENKNYYTDHETGRELEHTDDTTGKNDKTEKTATVGNSKVSENKTTTHSGTDTTTDINEVSAFNSSDYQDNSKNTTDLDHGEVITDEGGGETESKGQQDRTTNIETAANKKLNETESVKETTHEHGNIGVSTNFDLQTGEYRLLNDFRPYDFIAGLFENELTLFIY